MKINAYLEYLYHFNCPNCKKWWSVGDWTYISSMTCPHCSVKLTVSSTIGKKQ